MQITVSIQKMKEYLALCIEGPSTIETRKIILEKKRASLSDKIAELQKSIDYINWKQGLYDDVLSGKTEYVSNLIDTNTINNYICYIKLQNFQYYSNSLSAV